jgi:hypothetical protein
MGAASTVTAPGSGYGPKLKPIRDPDSAAGQLAQALRDLVRAHAGGESLRTLAQRAHMASATVSEALSGDPRYVPSLMVIEAISTACNADQQTLAHILELRERAIASRASQFPESIASLPAPQSAPVIASDHPNDRDRFPHPGTALKQRQEPAGWNPSRRGSTPLSKSAGSCGVRRSVWRALADGIGGVFDVAGITSVLRRESRPSAWEHLEGCLADKYARLKRDGIPVTSNSREDLLPGNSNDGMAGR